MQPSRCVQPTAWRGCAGHRLRSARVSTVRHRFMERHAVPPAMAATTSATPCITCGEQTQHGQDDHIACGCCLVAILLHTEGAFRDRHD